MGNAPGNSYHLYHYSYMIYSQSHKKPLPVLGLLLFIVPAIQYGCSDVNPVSCQYYATSEKSGIKTALSLSGNISPEGACLDIFTFNDDMLKRLDSYTRVENFTGNSINVTSQSGDKIILICANARKDRYEWADISSYSSMQSITVSLENESEDNPSMTATCRATAGNVIEGVCLQPVASEVILRSISCDFTGLPYAGKEISDVKAYLTNVNAEAYLFEETPGFPLRIINMSMLNHDDIKGFMHPGLVVRKVADRIGSNPIVPHLCFMCYHNSVETEGPGTPFTRLVIEGKIDGDTYYWPININRQGEKNGIGRNCRYIFDLTIRRKGTTDPDIPVLHEDIETTLEIIGWKESQEEYIEF